MILHEKPDCKQNVFKAHEKHCAKAIAGHVKGRKGVHLADRGHPRE